MCIATTALLTIAGFTAAGIASNLALAGGIVSTISNVQENKNAKAQAEYMADQASQNARLSSRQAEDIELQGNQERQQLRTQMLQALGEGRTGYAASGVVLGSGSAADYEADVADAYDLDRRNLNYDIASRSWQQKVAAVNYQNQASWYDSQASAYSKAGKVSLLSGILGTAGNTVGAASSVIPLVKSSL